ncbi:hypothetical protein [Bacillus alkalicellulosilyticus]|uniref:hypothetical protein n=1 Tax=Alkalihalobacterium alkalicellulosilyticum TaxID=1912214 RepID=UPI001481DBA5|nr:hypothetical protein [Bacillus alkalicellulosilyticus]
MILTITVFLILLLLAGLHKTKFSPGYEEFHLFKKHHIKEDKKKKKDQFDGGR